ncbi:hypothetical protein PVAP13_5KG447014 [Panicum virgatum]|uniref:Uncharacterized protein n=1 Tax=Panicum virgatum TaxID=38727 RepID=A0A8T0SRI1_PANVG|nr:hypothetical protein PVAP13_5KG447014 [Panicum virgatum]
MVRLRRAVAPVTAAPGAAAVTTRDARSGALEGGSGASAATSAAAALGDRRCCPASLVSLWNCSRRPSCGGAVVLCCPCELMRALSAECNGRTHIRTASLHLYRGLCHAIFVESG